MIRICLVVNSLMFGGVEKVIENYLKDFDKSQYQFTIVAQDNSQPEHIKYFESLGFKIKVITHKRKNFFKNYFELKKIVKNGKFDVVHSHMSYTNFYVMKIAKKMGVKIRINHYHNVFTWTGLKKKVVHICNRLCDKYATMNVFCSDAVKEFFGKTKNRSIVINNAIDLERFRFSECERKQARKDLNIEDKFVVGHVGRFMKQKNHSFLIDIFYEIQKLKPNSKLLLCGSGPLEEDIRQKVANLGIEHKVTFLGQVDNPHEIYQAMDIFVLPSLYEGLPVVGVEAQASGLPCVFSSSVTREAQLLESTIMLELENSAEVWASNLDKCKVNEKRTFAYQQIVGTKFDLKKAKKDFLKLYDINGIN